MYEKTDKRRLYWIIDEYISGNIDEPTFCDEFYFSFGREIDYNDLTKYEDKIFSELYEISSRFSQFEEDHKKHPGVFYTKEELKQKIIETREKLKKRT